MLVVGWCALNVDTARRQELSTLPRKEFVIKICIETTNRSDLGQKDLELQEKVGGEVT
jgi:hypothetical protein